MPKPVIYTTAVCPGCFATKRWLNKHDISFIEVDATEVSVVQYLKSLGHSKAPVVEVDEVSWAGYDEEKLAKYLL